MLPVVPIEWGWRQVLQELVDFRGRLVDVDVAHEVLVHEVVERLQLALRYRGRFRDLGGGGVQTTCTKWVQQGVGVSPLLDPLVPRTFKLEGSFRLARWAGTTTGRICR